MSPSITTIPYSQLVAADAINARAASKEGIDELAASIAAKGLIQALAVRLADSGPVRGGERYEVIDGRRRLQALASLVKAKKLAKDAPIPCLVRNEDDAEALETSLMANTVRLPMHPVDQHHVFARLAEQGAGEADIAARFGIAEKTVKQHLALGRLADPVRAAWRKGKIDAKTAQAFAVHPDPAVQAATLESLGKNVTDWHVRQQLSGQRERLDQSDDLALIGEAAYLAAGGTITDDLFDDHRYSDDVPLAKKLARDALFAECERLRADGWAWAMIDTDDDAPDSWACEHVRGDGGDEDLPPDAYAAEEKARAGCLVEIGFSSKGPARVRVATGLILPDDVGGRQADLEDDAGDDGDDAGDDAPTRAPTPEPETDDPFAASQALEVTLHEALTVAAARVIANDPLAALQVLVAQLECSGSGGPVKISDSGNAVVSDRHKRDWTERLRRRSCPLLVTGRTEPVE